MTENRREKVARHSLFSTLDARTGLRDNEEARCMPSPDGQIEPFATSAGWKLTA